MAEAEDPIVEEPAAEEPAIAEEPQEPAEPKKEKPLECPACEAGAPAWMATFADMATLLMAFFVLILSFTEMDSPSINKDISGSMSSAFGLQREVPTVEPPMGTSMIADAYKTTKSDPGREAVEETTDEEESSSLFPYSLLPSSFPRAQFLEGEGSVAINAALSSFSPRREHAFDTAEAAITDSDDYDRYAMIDSFSSEEIETSLPLSPAAKSRGLRVEYKLDGTPSRSPEGGAEALMASSPMSISDHESESWQREPRTTYALSSSSDEDESR